MLDHTIVETGGISFLPLNQLAVRSVFTDVKVGVYEGVVHLEELNILLSRNDYLFKLLLIGDSGVGKSCLLLRFAMILMWKATSVPSEYFFSSIQCKMAAEVADKEFIQLTYMDSVSLLLKAKKKFQFL
ncbi:hypothetical protein Droror1_Dr00020345, partial [Drosera rotundifolia]